jgi:hypothetical protein
MAFEYSQVEDDVVARLLTPNALPAAYRVIPMPEKESEFDNGLKSVLIIVAYSDSLFDTPTATDIVKQNETVTVLCNIKSPRLRGENSINQALQLLKILLVGYRPSNLSKLWLQKIEFDERNVENNYFSYNMTFAGKKLNVEVTADELLPLLQAVTFREQYQAPEFI